MTRATRSLFVLTCLFALAPVYGNSVPPDAAPAAAASEHSHTIYLVRHGAYDMKAKADPAVGPSLTPLGISQAKLVAARLRALPVRFDSMTSSTMTRARETAAVIHESLTEVPLDSTPLLSECTPPAFQAISGESTDEMTKCATRLDEAFGTLITPTPGADRNDLLVCHGNVIRYFVSKALRIDPRSWLGMTVAHASLTVIRVRADGSMKVIGVGDVGHIPANLQSWGTKGDAELVVLK